MVRREKLKKWCELHKLVRLRQRYILTKSNKVRLRYLVGGSAAMIAALLVVAENPDLGALTGPSAFQVAMMEEVNVDVGMLPKASEIQMAAAVEAAKEETKPALKVTQDMQNQISSGIRKASLAIKKASSYSGDVEIARGQTLTGVLETAGVGKDDAFKAVQSLSKHMNPRHIKAGQRINIQFRPGVDETPQFVRLSMDDGPLRKITVRKSEEVFEALVEEKEVKPHVYAGYAKVQNSLYGSAERSGIPKEVLSEVIKLYSRSIDFQRDIRSGDEIEVLYAGQQTDDGKYKKYGDVLYANLVTGGKSVPLYRYETQDGTVDYYDERGQTTKKTLMKTPVDGARMSSGFGMRRHPVLGYSKMHKGVDFAAPTGTPIYAAGDGTVEFAGRKGGYGNFVKIRHNSEIRTAYGHMYRFAANTRSGARVKQGQVIGYVGTTGQSTGPHLHYEVLVNGRQVNPRSIDLPAGENLSGRELNRFKRSLSEIRQQYVSLSGSIKLAQNETPPGSRRFN